MSSRRKHIQKKLAKMRPKKPFYKKAVFWYSILFFIIAAGLAYFLVFFDGVQIKTISVLGTQRLNQDDIKSIVEKSATNDFINVGSWKLSSKSMFLVKSDQIQKAILDSNATIENATVAKKWPNKLEITIKEREQIAVFCQEGRCFDIDANGIIFKEAADNDANANLIVRQNQQIENLYVGETAIQKNIMLAIYEIEKKLKENFQINLTEAMISTPIRLDVKTGEGWQIYFDVDADADINSQLTKLDLLLKQEIPQEQRTDLQYIDLRFNARAFYK